MKAKEVEMISLEELVPSNHVYRKFLKLLNFQSVSWRLQRFEKNTSAEAKGYGMEILFRCLLLQFIEDLSDRELEKILQENIAAIGVNLRAGSKYLQGGDGLCDSPW